MNVDTIHLLKECNAGCKMATDTIEQVLPHIREEKMKEELRHYNETHVKLGDKCHELLNRFGKNEKDPTTMAKVMAKVETGMKIMADDSGEKIAELMVDGCGMGIKSLHRSLNQCSEADAEVKRLAKDIIDAEEKFMRNMYAYL